MLAVAAAEEEEEVEVVVEKEEEDYDADDDGVGSGGGDSSGHGGCTICDLASSCCGWLSRNGKSTRSTPGCCSSQVASTVAFAECDAMRIGRVATWKGVECLRSCI